MFFSALFILVQAQSYWNLTGNSNVTNSNFIGHTITNECIPLNFKTRNVQRMRLGSTSSFLELGTTANTNTSLHVHYQQDDFNCGIIGPADGETDFSGGKRLLQLTTPETGDRAHNGFLVTSSRQRELLFKQQEQANFYIEGVGGGVTIAPNGNLGIGTSNPQSKLAVNGKITAKEVEVTLSGWPDFVFAKDYKLLPLSKVEQFISENYHLPNVPSAATVETNGINLGEMNAILLQKVEELTLYIIEQEKQMQELGKRLSELEAKKGGE